MRLLVYTCGFFLLLAMLIGCINTKSNSVVDNGKNHAISDHMLLGSYAADLPCADCEAIATVLTLKGNREYKLEYNYVGKSVESFVKTGNWDLKNAELMLEGIDYKYKVEKDQLRQLDLSGKEIAGELAEHYVLRSMDK